MSRSIPPATYKTINGLVSVAQGYGGCCGHYPRFGVPPKCACTPVVQTGYKAVHCGTCKRNPIVVKDFSPLNQSQSQFLQKKKRGYMSRNYWSGTTADGIPHWSCKCDGSHVYHHIGGKLYTNDPYGKDVFPSQSTGMPSMSQSAYIDTKLSKTRCTQKDWPLHPSMSEVCGRAPEWDYKAQMEVNCPRPVTGDSPDKANGFTQVSSGFTQVRIKYENTWKELNNDRVVFVATPDGEPPKDGWPCLLFFQFMDKDGVVSNGQYTLRKRDGGIQIDKNFPTASPLYNNIMDVMHQTLKNKVKIICIGQFRYDSMFYLGCDWTDAASTTDNIIQNICYNAGDNPDFEIFNLIFDDIHDKTKYLDDIDYSRIGLWGYSVGAQMVSRCIQSFPGKTTKTGRAYPAVKYGVMVAGGSYGCYDYEGMYVDTKLPPPQNCLPCKEEQPIGCCPHNYTEAYYGEAQYTSPDGTDYKAKDGVEDMSAHPPVLLLQSKNDKWADPNASTYYYDLVSQGGGKVWKNDYPATDAIIQRGNRHGIYEKQVEPAVRFISYFSSN